MITFFRRIRRNLLESNSTSRYIFYALGEVVLVVLGILIALQINNWNQERTDRKLEVEFLQRLISDVNIDRQLLDFAIRELDEKQEALRKTKQLLENPLAIPFDSVKTIVLNGANFSFSTPNERQNTTYIELVSSGNLGLIQNDNLLNQIVQFYTRWDHALVRIEKRRTDYGEMIVKLADFYNVLPGEDDLLMLNEVLTRNNLKDEFQLLLIAEINFSGFLHLRFDRLSFVLDDLLVELESDCGQKNI